MSYSQNNEEQIIADYFGSYIPCCLSIGENNGRHLSNVLALIERGADAVLIEPSPKAYEQLQELHKDRPNVYCYEIAIGRENGIGEFYESGEHLGIGDVALLSTLDIEETTRWGATTEFIKTRVQVRDFNSFIKHTPYEIYEFISVDAEGFDLCIIEQIDFEKLGTRLLCVEYNGKDLDAYRAVMDYWGFTILHTNLENILFCK